MNKPLKTIAWICLVLGLLGTAVDGGMLLYGRKITADRQAIIEAIQTEIQSGDIPDAKNNCVAEDIDQDGKPDGDCLQQQAPWQPGTGQPAFGGRLMGRDSRLGVRGGFAERRIAVRGILPLFFLALGPILLVVGAVILLINREPNEAAVKEEKEVKETREQKKK